MAKVTRHPKACPTSALIGTPNATATDVPPVTIAKALPLCSGGTMAPAKALAFGTYSPASSASSTRANISVT